MCLIVGYYNFENSLDKVLNSFNKLSYRGEDYCGVYFQNNIFGAKNLKELKKNISFKKNPSLVLGHRLLSIVNYLEQPIFKKDFVFISNCEIYNWEELKLKYNLNSKNDSELLFDLIILKGENNLAKVLEELDGPFSFCLFNIKKNNLILSKDLLGVKPLFYYIDLKNKKFAFCSESKVLPKDFIELKPTQILNLNLNNFEINFLEKEFFKLKQLDNLDFNYIFEKTKYYLIEAIKKRIPKNQKIGVLFSGGIDSTFICYVLKKLNIKFTCYTCELFGGNILKSSDLIYAKEIAKRYDFDLKISKINVLDLEPILIKVIKLIESRDYIKTSVALPFFLASSKAKKDNIKVIFSGLGSEEIFAGYNRHKKVENINQECLNGLKILYQRDLYRDDVITMANNIELRLPFLDKNLINYALNIPDDLKIDSNKKENKVILRKIANDLGLDLKYCNRPKKAAQYGSKFDKGLLRLAKNKNLNKQDYLNSLDVGEIKKIKYKN